MRARTPDASGFVERHGVHVYWEAWGDGDPAMLFMHGDTIVDARMWKAQIPYFARRHRVATFDPRGNGRSDRPLDPAAYADQAFLGDAVAVLDAAGIGSFVVIGLCQSAGLALVLAADHPDRVRGVVAINPGLRLTPKHPHRAPGDFDTPLDSDAGWAKENRHYWRRDWLGYTEFFFDEMFPEPHSTKAREDCVEWAQQIPPEIMLAYLDQPEGRRDDEASAAQICSQIRCPVLVICGDQDRCQPPERSRIIADLTGGELLVIEGGGHLPHARDPVKVNLEIGDFVRRIGGQPAASR